MKQIGKLTNIRRFGDEMRTKINNIEYGLFTRDVQDAFFSEIKPEKWKDVAKEDINNFIRKETSDYLVRHSKNDSFKFKPIDCHFHDVEDSIVTVSITTTKSALPRGVSVTFFKDEAKNETFAEIYLAANQIGTVGPFVAQNRNELAYAMSHLLNQDNYFHRFEVNSRYHAPKNKEQIMLIVTEAKKQIHDIKAEVEKIVRDVVVEIKPSVVGFIEDAKLQAMYTEEDLSLSKALKEFGYLTTKNTQAD